MSSGTANERRFAAVVAGGGPAGLFAAWKLAQAGHRVHVLEREEVLGGLAASVRRGANVYAYGTHHLHSPDPAQIAPFQDLVGAELVALERRLKIKFMDRFYPYPLSARDLLLGMPPALMIGSLFSLGRALLGRGARGEPENAEEAIIRLYGRKLYDLMFRDYTARFWGVPVERISKTFVDKRMPGINAIEKLKRLLARARLISAARLGKTAVIGSGAMHTTARGVGPVFEALGDAIRRLGGAVETGTEVAAVLCDGDRVRAVVCRSAAGEREIPCDLLVSTIPIPHLGQRLRPAPPAPVLAAANRLGFRALLVVALLVRPKRRLDALFTYFPDRVFHRLAEVAGPPAQVHPPECSILLAELTCDEGDAVWNDPEAARAAVVEDLVAEGLIDRGGVLETHCLKAAHAYPRYALGFESDLESLLEHVRGYANLTSTGRQGAFQFTSMVPSMHLAWRQTQELLQRMGSHPARWKE